MSLLIGEISDRRGPHLNSNDCFKKEQTADKRFELGLSKYRILVKGDMLSNKGKSFFITKNKSFLACSFDLQNKKK